MSDSAVHLTPETLNALLAEFVDQPGKLRVFYETGRIRIDVPGLALTITQLHLTADGVDIRLQLARAGDAHDVA